jgi:hypothetical protein
MSKTKPKTDYAEDWNDFSNDVTGETSKKKQESGNDSSSGPSSLPTFMFFDFRRGPSHWPAKCELLSHEKAVEEIQKVKDLAVGGDADDTGAIPSDTASTGTSNKTKDDVGSAPAVTVGGASVPLKDSKGDFSAESKSGGLNELPGGYDGFGYSTSAQVDSSDSDDDIVERGDEAIKAEARKNFPAPKDAAFELLGDGQTFALVIQAGQRLKLNVTELLVGGDATREERDAKAVEEEKRKKKEEERRKKKKSWGGWGEGSWGGWGSRASDKDLDKKKPKKNTALQWTLTIDLKIKDSIPVEGISLLQTQLVHSEEETGGGPPKLTETEGEAFINCDGGVGNFGTFGDVSRACVETNKWHRVVVSANVEKSGKDCIGELRTWVDGVPACVCRNEEIATANGRFELDFEKLFLFSSSNVPMMPGNIMIRAVRVENHFTNDKEVKEQNTRDRIANSVEEERARKIDDQRRGFALAPLHAKPRPMWMNLY